MNERVPLSFLLTQNASEEPPVEPVVPFAAVYGEAPKIVTAVLERTAVLAEPSDRYERVSVRHELVLVDPAVIEWRTKTATYEGSRLNGAARERKHISNSPWRVEMATTYEAAKDGRTNAQQREVSDARALKNRQEIKQTEENEMRFLRQRSAEKAAQKEKEEVNEATVTVATPLALVGAGDYSGSPMRVPAVAQQPEPAVRKVKLRHCHRCGKDKPKIQFKVKRGKGVCEECRAKPELKVGRATGEPRAEVAEIPSDGTVVELSAPKLKRKYTRRGTTGKPVGRRKAKAATATVLPTGHRNGRPSLTFKELIERIVSERDALKARVDELEAERAQAFAQLQEVLG